MSQTSDTKSGQFFEWYTELPFGNRPRESPTFWLHNFECYFFFSRCISSISYNYSLYLMSKVPTIVIYKEPLSLVIYYDPAKSGVFRRSKVKLSDLYSCQLIFSFDENDLSDRGPISSDGVFIQFCFLFESEIKPMLPIKPKIEDKCVQTSSYMNAVTPVESVSEDFSKLLNAGVNHDAEIKCGKHSIKVHKIILSARSDVFKSMLESDLQEGRTGIVEIQDMDISHVQDFVKYMYTGEIPELDFDKAKTLYEVGDKYNIQSLMLRCSEYLQENLTQENAFECCGLADKHSDKKFQDAVKTFILKEKMYLQDEIWQPFCESYPALVIEVYRLSHKRKISETENA